MRTSLSLPLFIWFIRISCLRSQITFPSQEAALSRWSKEKSLGAKIIETENLFNPKMDYDEWTPLGRGDPLKNDPTYDYVPPVLERVHYWIEPSKRTPDPPLLNSGVLVAGSESTFTARPTTSRYQQFKSKEPQADSRIDTSSLLDPFFKLIDVSQFGMPSHNSHLHKPTANRIQRPQHSNNRQKTQAPQALQRPPYTMLMPPPPPPASRSTQNVDVGQSSTTSERTSGRPTTVALPETTNNATTIHPNVLANTENVFKPVAISMPGQVDHMIDDAPKQKKASSQIRSTLQKPESEESAASQVFTTLQNNKKQPYEANFKQVQKQSLNLNHLHHATTAKYKPAKSPTRLAEDQAERMTSGDISRAKRPDANNRVNNHFVRDEVKGARVERPYENKDALRATTVHSTTTTTITTAMAEISGLTTDPLFRHYKQPYATARGPFYLIIQGHSKVKTYGASKNPINRLLTSNEIKQDKEEEKKMQQEGSERKVKKLKYDYSNDQTGNDDLEYSENWKNSRSFLRAEEDNLENLEETFPKSEGGSSKKRYLGSNHRRKRSGFAVGIPSSEADCRDGGNVTDKGEGLDLESLIAVGDDYDSGEVADILLSPQGSGYGNPFTFARSQKELVLD